MSTLPHLTRVEAVRLSAPTHAERGRARGRQLAGRITSTARGYAELFSTLGIPGAEQREAASASLEAVRAWHPALHEELTGIADGAGLDLVDLGRVLARTEILTLAPEATSDRRFRCVATTILASKLTHSSAPSLRTFRASMARSSLGWRSSGSSPISSMNSVPPSTCSRRPACAPAAPVKAPRT